MPTVIAEDGSGMATSNAYVSPISTFAVDYFASHLHAAAWVAATSGTKESAVIQATRMLDAAFSWIGYRKSTTQALGWPRYGVELDGVSQDDLVPTLLKQGTLEQALALINGDRTGSSITQTASAVSRIGLGRGAIEIEMGASGSGTSNLNLGFLTDYVAKLLAPLGQRNDARQGGPQRTYRV